MTPARTTSRTWVLLLLVVVATSACGPRTKQQRQSHGDKRTDEATLLLNEASQHLRELNADRAEPLLAKAEKVLAHPDVDLSPEGDMLRSELAELQARVPRVREEKVRREKESVTDRERKEREAIAERERKALEATVEKQRDAVVEAMFAVTEALDALEARNAGSEQVTAASDAIQRTRERLKTGKELEAKSEDYAASARSTERRLEQAETRLQSARRVIDFVSGPLGESQEAPALEKKAKREKDLEARLSIYTDVRNRYLRCGSEADKLLSEMPELARSPLSVKGRPMALKAVAAGCKKKAGLTQRTVVKVQKAKVKWEKAQAKREKAREKMEKLKAAREKAREAARQKALARKRK
ncbi:hypothetical protein [Archangium lansingense]|uniref:DUF4398 domain-containing protein n=1 Tax=Archangium lansingense TaxID=2995310 RepID=A0ABT4AIN4_9BACT|nr:hypothetical protein [Archangium lansinium]MCY1081540.1 hypothetical protein [Archangium lansinium]